MLWLVIIAAVVLGATLPGIVRPWLRRRGLVDVPNQRSSHTVIAIRGVGVAPAIILIGGLLVVLLSGWDDKSWPLVAGCVVIFIASLVGLIEDVRGVSPKTRAALQFSIGILGASIIFWNEGIPLWWIPSGAFIVAAYINVANFMDGINGISGGHGLCVGLHYLLVGMIANSSSLTIMGCLLAIVMAGFLPWNLIHGRMFLGDVGSYMLGSTVAVMSLLALVQNLHPVTVLGPVAVYLTDAGITLLRRIATREDWMAAHRSHFYQKMAVYGRSHWKVSLLVSAFGAATGAAGLVALWNPVVGWTASLAAIILLVGLYVWVARKLSVGRLSNPQASEGLF